ncbi:MAG: GNAT family N-acetyltransferase, partial [Ferruginibacter sp.]
MFTLLRIDSDNIVFKPIVALFDKDLQVRDGDEHSFCAQFNKIDAIKNVVVCFAENEAIGCGAFNEYDNETVEVKRMFVKPAH